MNNLPVYVSIIIMLVTFLTVWLFYRATNKSKATLLVLTGWLALQSVLGLSGFFTVTDTIPPRFALTLVPPIVFIIMLFTTARGRRYLDSLDVKRLTLLHTIRIPVELVIFALFAYKTLPQVMTFEGSNLDVLSGLTAPVIFFLVFIKKKFNRNVLLAWNFICLGLLINIVAIAILAAPFPFQKLAFDQPNIAVLYFPFVWLPCCIVPLVLLSHLASIRQLLSANRKAKRDEILLKTQLAYTK